METCKLRRVQTINEVKNMTDFTKDTLKTGSKEIATKVIPIVLASVGGILVKIINQEK